MAGLLGESCYVLDAGTQRNKALLVSAGANLITGSGSEEYPLR